MYYELGTIVCIRKDASPFVNHERGISIPSIDVVGELVSIHPMMCSYDVRLSKKYVLTFSEDDIYGLPDWMSDKRYLFHKMLGSIIQADARSFFSVKAFEDFINRAEKQSTMYFQNYRYDPKFMENMMYPVKSSLTALEELNRREFERIAASPIRIDIDDAIKANYSIEEIKKMINKDFGVSGTYTWNLYKKIIFNGPCTIILWTDGTKTIAKTSSDEEIFDPEKGVAICFMKKMLGHTETNKILRKANKDFYDEVARKVSKEFYEELKKTVFPLPKGVTFRPFTFDKSMDNKVIKVEENHKMDFRSCLDCKYASKPVTDKPCSDCAGKSRFEKGEKK